MRRGLAVVVGAIGVAAIVVGTALWLGPGLNSTVPPSFPALGPGETTVAYTSSVDGFALSYSEWLPAGYTPTQTYPLAIYLHHIEDTSGHPRPGGFWNQLSGDGGGPAAISAASAAGFLLIAPNT